MKQLQLHRLQHVFPFPKPEDQFVTLLHAFGRKPYPVIQISQFIRPFLPVILLLKLLKNRNPFLKPHVLRLIELILKDIFSAVIRRDLFKILIIRHRAYHIPHSDGQVAERIQDHPAGRMTFICHLQQQLGVFKPAVYLIHIADCTEHHHALHSRPVDRVGDSGRFHVFFL